MRLSLSYKDYEAISFAIDQIESSLESSENIEWNKEANDNMKRLYGICKRFQNEKLKSDELNEARRYIRSRNTFLPQSKVDKMAREVIKRKNK